VEPLVKAGDVVAERYVVEHVIGTGGMGIVVCARHRLLGERVAIKVLHPQYATNEQVVSRFFREARAAAKLQSDHIVRVLDVGILPGGAPYLVMEHLSGRDLSALVQQRGPLPLEEAVTYALQAAVGVAEAHALGMVHRDVKPSNLFLVQLAGARTCVKVVDFGIAKHAASDGGAVDLTDSFSVLGSAAYMSPEQIRHPKGVDTRSDVWSFGVVLFELLTAALPFTGESPTSMLAAIVGDEPVPLRRYRPDAPAQIEDLILGCLAKDRTRRVPSLVAFAAKLSPFGGPDAEVLERRVRESLGVSFASSDDTDPTRPSAPAARSTRSTWAVSRPPPGSVALGKKPLLALSVAALFILFALAFIYRPAAKVDPADAPSVAAHPVASTQGPAITVTPRVEPRDEPGQAPGHPASIDISTRRSRRTGGSVPSKAAPGPPAAAPPGAMVQPATTVVLEPSPYDPQRRGSVKAAPAAVRSLGTVILEESPYRAPAQPPSSPTPTPSQ
jgi:serine/threonine-protein kinase